MAHESWTSAIETGRAAMDAEHRVEMALLEVLEDAVRRDLGPNRVNEILEQLLEHTTVHFMSEQLLMRLTAYPQYEAHADEHDRLTEQAAELQGHIEAGRIQPALSFIDSMRRWLTQHIDGKDKAFTEWLDTHHEVR